MDRCQNKWMIYILVSVMGTKIVARYPLGCRNCQIASNFGLYLSYVYSMS